ncbi:hypothetical protein QUF80_19085 [Desulfococcaceae bacterium HSG8]|nr:hypothetical protein [Desulfococcaceae bacterium HSG8]
MSNRTEQKMALLLCCSRGIGKSPALHMLRICQSEPSRRGSCCSVVIEGLTNPRTAHASDLSIRTEQKRALLLRLSW